VAQLVETLHYMPDGRGLGFQIGYFFDVVLPAAL
jgi:hypothetical protein